MKASASRTKTARAAQTVRPLATPMACARFAGDPPSMDEPPLQEMLKDPILQRLMRSDKVEPAQLQSLLADARSRLFS